MKQPAVTIRCLRPCPYVKASKTLKWWFLWTIIFLASCSVKVNTFYDQTAAFETYQTFCWFENCQFTIEGPAYLRKDSATVEIFKTAIVDELERKGFTYDQNNPDFLLHMHIVVEEQEGVITSPYSTGDPDDWYWVFSKEKWVDQTYVYLKGSLIIDIADANESRMVWRSDAVEYLDISTDITNSRLKRAIKKTLKKFPPGD